MNNEDKILALLEQMRSENNARFDKLEAKVDAIQEDVEIIKEDAAATRETANGLGEWAEIAADVLRVKYPVKE